MSAIFSPGAKAQQPELEQSKTDLSKIRLSPNAPSAPTFAAPAVQSPASNQLQADALSNLQKARDAQNLYAALIPDIERGLAVTKLYGAGYSYDFGRAILDVAHPDPATKPLIEDFQRGVQAIDKLVTHYASIGKLDKQFIRPAGQPSPVQFQEEMAQRTHALNRLFGLDSELGHHFTERTLAVHKSWAKGWIESAEKSVKSGK